MSEMWKRIASFFVGVVATFFKMYGAILGLVCIAIVFDIISGVISSKVLGIEVTSKKANQGFWKKVGLLLALFFGVFLDMFIPIALQFLSVELPFNMPFGLTFGCYIIFNEGISICENLNKINPTLLPPWVAKLLKGGTEAINKEIEEGIKHEKRH